MTFIILYMFMQISFMLRILVSDVEHVLVFVL